MTVGIAAMFEGDGERPPGIIVAADRLVTTGYSTRIEYEHTQTKIQEVVNADNVSAFSVAAGSLSLADELFLNLEAEIAETGPTDVRSIVEEGIDAYHTLERDTFDNQVLSPLGLELEDLRDGDLAFSDEYQSAFLEELMEKKEEIESNLTVLIAGIDRDGPHIYSLERADFARHDNLGYAMIGSGNLSAQLTFTRNRYDRSCSYEDALMTVVEAKARAEEAQGVGQKMDIAIIRRDEPIKVIEGDDVEPLRELQDEIEKAEAEARETVIEENELDILNE